MPLDMRVRLSLIHISEPCTLREAFSHQDRSFIEDEAPDRKSSAACTSINIYLHEGEAYVASSYHQGAGHDPQGNS